MAIVMMTSGSSAALWWVSAAVICAAIAGPLLDLIAASPAVKRLTRAICVATGAAATGFVSYIFIGCGWCCDWWCYIF